MAVDDVVIEMRTVDVSMYIEGLRSKTLISSRCIDAFLLTSNVAKSVMHDMLEYTKVSIDGDADEAKERLMQRLPERLHRYHLVTAYKSARESYRVYRLALTCSS